MPRPRADQVRQSLARWSASIPSTVKEKMHRIAVHLFFYLLSLSKRAMMAAICSRVALPCGWKVPSVKPVTTPLATAQATAGLA